MKHYLALSAAFCLAALSTTAFAACGPHKSLPSVHMVDVKFENNTSGVVNVTWYTFNGGRKMYQSLAAGQSMCNRHTPNMFGSSPTRAVNVFPLWWSRRARRLRFNEFGPREKTLRKSVSAAKNPSRLTSFAPQGEVSYSFPSP
jgi:hypothetical protein